MRAIIVLKQWITPALSAKGVKGKCEIRISILKGSRIAKHKTRPKCQNMVLLKGNYSDSIVSVAVYDISNAATGDKRSCFWQK